MQEKNKPEGQVQVAYNVLSFRPLSLFNCQFDLESITEDRTSEH